MKNKNIAKKYIIVPHFNKININGSELEFLKKITIETCFVEILENGRIGTTAFNDETNIDVVSDIAYKNIFNEFTKSKTSNYGDKYLFDTYVQAEKILALILFHYNNNGLKEQSDYLIEKYPESLI